VVIQQLSVFIENKPGRLVEVTDLLAQHQVDIIALSLADTSDFGVLRLIVDKPAAAQTALKEGGLIVKITDVLAVAMQDQPGGLSTVLHHLTDASISVEYMYAFVGKREGKAVVVMRVSDLDAAAALLFKDADALVNARDIYNL
jgi:hypothetical protein